MKKSQKPDKNRKTVLDYLTSSTVYVCTW